MHRTSKSSGENTSCLGISGRGFHFYRACLARPRIMAATCDEKLTVEEPTAFSASNLSFVMSAGFQGYPALSAIFLPIHIKDKTIEYTLITKKNWKSIKIVIIWVSRSSGAVRLRASLPTSGDWAEFVLCSWAQFVSSCVWFFNCANFLLAATTRTTPRQGCHDKSKT